MDFRATRRGLGIGARAFAAALKISPSSLQRIETGKRPPSPQVAGRLAALVAGERRPATSSTVATLPQCAVPLPGACGSPILATNGSSDSFTISVAAPSVRVLETLKVLLTCGVIRDDIALMNVVYALNAGSE